MLHTCAVCTYVTDDEGWYRPAFECVNCGREFAIEVEIPRGATREDLLEEMAAVLPFEESGTLPDCGLPYAILRSEAEVRACRQLGYGIAFHRLTREEIARIAVARLCTSFFEGQRL